MTLMKSISVFDVEETDIYIIKQCFLVCFIYYVHTLKISYSIIVIMQDRGRKCFATICVTTHHVSYLSLGLCTVSTSGRDFLSEEAK